jgi:uncharacterized protein (UPF0335 family)
MSDFGGVSGAQLKQIIDKIERLEEEKAGLASDIREVYGEAKSHGFDVKIIRKILSLRKMDQDELAEHEELLTLYMNALNMSDISVRKGNPALDEAA